jgi:predicted histidine transporter YuiF (NhaC family)
MTIAAEQRLPSTIHQTIKQSYLQSASNLDWLRAHFHPYVFIDMQNEVEAISTLSTWLHTLARIRRMVLAFTFADINEKLGFLNYVIDSAKVFMTPEMLPFVVFIVLGITEFIMGLSWGMYAIAIPIVIPLALAVGANPVVAVGAVCSAGVWGSHICFYSDATILSSAASGCDNYRHAVTQMPYGFLGAALTALGFLAIGFLGI